MAILVLASYVNAHCLQVEQLPLPGESLCAASRWAEHGNRKGSGLAIKHSTKAASKDFHKMSDYKT
jgi:ribokinase